MKKSKRKSNNSKTHKSNQTIKIFTLKKKTNKKSTTTNKSNNKSQNN